MSPPKAKTFNAVLEPLRNGLGWVIARIPFDVAEGVAGAAAVAGARGDFFFEKQNRGIRVSHLAVCLRRAAQGHFLLVNKKMQAGAKAAVGERVRIRLEPDLEERAVETPPELERALKGDRRLPKWFAKLSESMRYEIGKWVSEPKSAESRQKRAEGMAERLLLTLEGEMEAPPILQAAFHRQPLARKGWEAMTPVQRRSHLLSIFYNQNADARERRAAKAVEEALRVAKRGSGPIG